MVKYVPASFDETRVLDGLRKAMGFGEPTRDQDKVTFYFNARSAGEGTDDDGVPFDPDDKMDTDDGNPTLVDCVVEYQDRAPQGETFGVYVPSRVVITVLDPDWQTIKDFAYAKVGGDIYWRSSVMPPMALGSLDVWSVICATEGES